MTFNKTVFFAAILLVSAVYAQTDLSIFQVTINDMKLARQLAKELLENKLAVNINLVGNEKSQITSFYNWDGVIERDNEILLIIKSKSSLKEKIEKVVSKIHTYDTPEIVQIPIVGANQAFIDFVNAKLA